MSAGGTVGTWLSEECAAAQCDRLSRWELTGKDIINNCAHSSIECSLIHIKVFVVPVQLNLHMRNFHEALKCK